MGSRLKPEPSSWWKQFALRIRRSVPEAVEIVRGASMTPAQFPHVRLRDANGEPEAYVAGTGLAVWEIAWLAMSTDSATSIAEQTYSDVALISEGLYFANEHRDEIDAQVRRHTQVTAEELRTLLPNIRVIKDDNNTSEHPSA